MNPNAGEPVNPGGIQGGVGVADKSAAPINTTPAAENPLAGLESVVAAAAQEAAAAQTTPSVQTPTETPEGQFQEQFGKPAPGSIDTALAGLETTPPPAADVSIPQPSADSLVPEQTQPVAEAPAKSEEDPQATFVQEIKDAVGKLEQATSQKLPI